MLSYAEDKNNPSDLSPSSTKKLDNGILMLISNDLSPLFLSLIIVPLYLNSLSFI